jgi:uncharacterized protein with PQ loop repeat
MGTWHGGISLPLIAGTISTSLYMISNLPMLLKALKTRSLKSYSFSTLALCNVGNVVHWLYIAHLPFGPIWFLHGFTSVSSALMLSWYVKYERQPSHVDHRARTTGGAPLVRPGRRAAR